KPLEYLMKGQLLSNHLAAEIAQDVARGEKRAIELAGQQHARFFEQLARRRYAALRSIVMAKRLNVPISGRNLAAGKCHKAAQEAQVFATADDKQLGGTPGQQNAGRLHDRAHRVSPRLSPGGAAVHSQVA